jgi:hypothetical protein
MPHYRTPEPPTTPSFRPVAEDPTRLQLPTASPAPAKAPDLTINKIIAGAGAAATSAVLGSFFGAAGTITGAALGSVASTVATVVYQRSLDRTRDTLVARVRLTPGRRAGVAEAHVTLPAQRVTPEQVPVPAQRVAPDAETVRLQVEPAIDRRPTMRRPWLWLAATVLVFVIGLLVVTGFEWAKGSTLTTGETGTSVGRVIDGGGGGAGATEESAPTESPEPSDTAPPSDDPTEEPTPNEEPTPTEEPEDGATETPEPTEEPRFGEGSQGGDDTGNSDRDTDRTPLIPVPGAPGE